MSFSYKVGNSSSEAFGNYHSVTPYWILVVVPYANRYTIDMEKLIALESDVALEDARRDPDRSDFIYILDDQCIKWNISSSKSNYVHNASFTLTPPYVIRNGSGRGDGVEKVGSKVEYEAKYDIAPQDWVMFWAMNDKKTYEDVLKRIKNKQAANYPDSGLKFVGKVKSFRTNGTISSTGVRSTVYSMECASFDELNNSIYFNPLLLPNTAVLATVNKLVEDINGVLVGNNQQIYVESGDAIATFTSLFFDVDFVERTIARASGTPSQRESLLNLATPNTIYVIPTTVALLLGEEPVDKHNKSYFSGIAQLSNGETTSITNSTYTYSDILYRYIGIESTSGSPSNKYADYFGDTNDFTNRVFVKEKYENTWLWKNPLSGFMVKQTLNFDNRSVWSILNTYLNSPVDELYTTLKLSPYNPSVFNENIKSESNFRSNYKEANQGVTTNKIMPSLICRQRPFTSKAFADSVPSPSPNKPSFAVTKFVDLPRWQIAEDIVRSYQIGLSDSNDFNYVHLEPQSADQSGGRGVDHKRATNLTVNPPFIDYADVSKNGLRIYQRPLSCVYGLAKKESLQEMRWYTALMSDIMMRTKYTSSGSLSCKGIQEPICVGDNAVFQDVLFHIEAVNHSGGIDMSGNKTFDTTLGLTFGIKEKNESNADFVPKSMKGGTD